MANSNLDTLNVRLLNFTGPTIYKDGAPWIPSIGNHFCVGYLGVGETINCPPAGYPPSLQVTENARISNTLFLSPEQGHFGGIKFQSNNPIGQSQQATSTIKFSNNFTTDASGFILGYNGTTDTSLNMISDTLNLFRLGDISNAIITIVGNTGYIGINKSSPSTDVDISGNVTIRGVLDMSCNSITDVSKISFCPNGGGIDLSCNPIKDVSGIYFCDGASLTAGKNTPLDISGAGISFLTNKGTEQMRIDMSGNVGIGTQAPQAKLDVSGRIFVIDACNNVVVGSDTMTNNTTGFSNAVFGFGAMKKNTTGFNNTAIGDDALSDCSSGQFNTAVGFEAGQYITTGSSNVAIGMCTLCSDASGGTSVPVTGKYNVALGMEAMSATNNNAPPLSVQSGSYNVVLGGGAGQRIKTGNDNIAIGRNALGGWSQGVQAPSTIIGPSGNIAIGRKSMWKSGDGSGGTGGGGENVGLGLYSLQENNDGSGNVAVGHRALATNTSGNYNSALGYEAGFTPTPLLSKTTCLGYQAYADISNVVILGDPNDASNNVGIGTSAPTEKLDVSGNVKIRNGHLDMSCNPIRDVSKISFCPNGGGIDLSCNPIKNVSGLFFCDGSGIDMSCNSITDVSKISFCPNGGGIDLSCNPIKNVSGLFFCDGSGIDMSCNSITDVSGIYFCDGASLTAGKNTPLDISGAGISFLTNKGTEQMRIDMSGNVGIGTSAPTEKLDVSGGNIKAQKGTGSNIDSVTIGTNQYGGAIKIENENPTTTKWEIFNNQNISLDFALNNNQFMRVEAANGNVGINNLSPQAKLDVNGRIFVIDACKNVVVGSDNTMTSNTTGTVNTVLGWNAIEKNTTGSNNVAVGCRALQNNTTGTSNVAVGCDTLKNNTNGVFNSCFGNAADASGVSFTTCLGFHAVADISNVVILGDPTDASNNVGIGTSAPTEKLDVSGNVKIRNGHLDMSCNPIKDVSGIYFCDGSSFTSGNSLDISASTVHISGTNLIVDASCSAQFFASNSGEFISNAPDGHLRLKPKTGTGNIIIYDGSGSIVIQPDPTGTIPGGLVRIDASECLVPYIVGPNIQPNSAATKQYVDNMVQGVTVFDHVKYATTSQITPFPPTSHVAIDGVSPFTGDRVLIKDQTSSVANGVYEVAANGNAWTRASDMSNNTNVAHVLIFVDNGVINNNTSWVVTGVADASGNVIVNTDDITFSKFASAGAINPGAGLYQSGQTLNVGASSNTQIVTTSLSPSTMDLWTFDADKTAKIDISGGTIYGGTQSAIESIQCLGQLLAGPFTAETLTLTEDISQNLVFAGPSGSSGAPSFRKLEISDMPSGHTSSQWDSSGSNIYFTGGNVGIGKTDPSGALDVVGTITATSFNAVSDLNKKENIDTILNATEKMTLLRGVSYNLKSDKNKKKHYGVVAQELEQIFPDMVNGEEGNKSVAYMEIIGVLIETVKDLNKRIENLEQSSNN